MSKIQHATRCYYLTSWVLSSEFLQMNSQNDGAGGFCTFAISFWHSTWNDNHDSRGKPYIQPHILRPICRLSLLAHRALLLVVVPHHPKKKMTPNTIQMSMWWLKYDFNPVRPYKYYFYTMGCMKTSVNHDRNFTARVISSIFQNASLCSSFVVALQHFVSKKHTLGTSWWSRSQLFGIDVVVIRLTYIYSRRSNLKWPLLHNIV